MKSSVFGKLHIRFISAVLAVLLIIGIFPVQAAVSGGAEAESILYNGSFDLPYTNSQTVSGWSMNRVAVIQSDVVYGNSGNALKIDAAAGAYFWAADFSVASGATYVLSYYIRVDSADSLRFAPFFNDSNYQGKWWKDYAVSPVCDVTQGWVKVSGTVTIPKSVGENTKNPQSKVQLGFKIYQGSGTLYLDAVSMVKTDIYLDDPNLNFEDTVFDGVPVNWQTSEDGVQLAGDALAYHAGSRSMYIRKTSLAEKSAVKSAVYLPVTQGDIYEFSFWMCSRNAAPTATIRMNLLPFGEDGKPIQENGEAAVVYGTVAALNGGSRRSDWTKVVTRAAVPEGTAYVSLNFIVTRGSAEIWLDDIFFQIVEDGTDCVVYYEDFHAVDEQGNISSWKNQGGSFNAENGGKLTVNGEEGYLYDTLQCLMTDYTYCVKGHYTAHMGGTVQVRFYDYRHEEYTQLRQTAPLQASGTEFSVYFTAPSHTYAAIYIGSDQTGTMTVSDVTVYMTAKPSEPNKNYLDADWSEKADRDNVVSSVELYNGIPTLMIDGQPTASHFYLRPDLNAYLQTDAESRIANSGLTLYVTYGGSLYKGGCDQIWLEDGSIDYAAFDAVIYDTLAASEDGLVMVNIGMFAPQWWLAQNPDHQAQAHNGSSYIALNDASLASEKFRQEAGEVLRKLLRHMKEQNYYNRVFGLKISGGQSYEWMHLGTGSNQGPDYSAASQEGFRKYLQSKYGTVEALRAAWGNDTVTFETAAAPGWTERCQSANVYMGDADTGSLSRNMVDWNLWLNEASADSFLYYCQIAKEETDNQIIVGGYNGYLWTSNTYDAQGMAHTAIDRVLDSAYVDWIASPIAYNERLLGQSNTYMALLDTVQAHGKLYIAEQDNRTCLADTYAGNSWDADWDYAVGQTRTMADTIYQQKRDFANALVNGAGLWQYDMYGGWLDDAQLYDYFRDAKSEYDLSVHLDRNTTNEVAVFVGDETYAYLTAENSNMSFKLLEPMLQQQRKHLSAMGAGYDTYAMSSLLEGLVPSHKLNIVLSPFEITEQMHTAIDTYLKTNNQVVVWVYLPGISTGSQLSLSNVQRATGFSVGAVETKSTLQVQLVDSGHSLTEGLAGLCYGNSATKGVSPLTYIQDTQNVTVLGYNTDGKQPGLAVKDMGDWTSVYSSAPCLDVQLLKNLMKLAGCHSYSENPADVVYSSNHYVALHSAAAGEKTIQLPGNYSVYDVFEKRFVSMNTDVITYYHQANDTHIFRLMKPNTYAVTAGIQKGKGTLSAAGLQEVTAGGSYSLTVTPACGYAVEAVFVNGKAVTLAENGVLKIRAVNENTVIQVRFQKQTYIENGGLESGSFGGSISGSGSVSVVSDNAVHSGLYALRLNHDGTARDLIEIEIPMNPSSEDRTLTISFWAKTAAGAVRSLHRGAHFFTQDWKKVGNSTYDAIYPGRDQWQQFTQVLTLPAGAEIIQYQLYTDTEKADVYIDDISILCDDTQMMINGSLERGNLTGSFSKQENTPEVLQSSCAYSGSYGAKITGSGVVSVTAENVYGEEEQQIAFSLWIKNPDNAVQYRITAGETLLSEGQWEANDKWRQNTAVCSLPAKTEAVQIQLSGACYLDDVQITVLPPKEPEKITLEFQQIFSDGTWRFTADDLSLLTESYYKLPAVLDGKDGYVVAHKTAGLLCVYPNFFPIYGGAVPTTSFVIPEGAMLRAVSASQQWQEIEGAEPIAVRQKVEVYRTEAYVKAWNLSLGGDLTVNFHMQLPESIVSEGQVVITAAGRAETFAIWDAPYDEEAKTYRFSIHMAAAQMTDEICVQTVCGGEELSNQTYTVRQYAMYVLEDEGLRAYHAVVQAMLCYGGAAQAYFGYHTDAPADAGLPNENTPEIPESVQDMVVSGEIEGIGFYGASLVYRDKIAVRFYFTGDAAQMTFTAQGNTYTPVAKGDMYYIEIGDIVPQDLDKQITLTVTDREGSAMTVTYGPMNYLVRMNQKGSDSLKTLLKAIYRYHLTAKAL